MSFKRKRKRKLGTIHGVRRGVRMDPSSRHRRVFVVHGARDEPGHSDNTVFYLVRRGNYVSGEGGAIENKACEIFTVDAACGQWGGQ